MLVLLIVVVRGVALVLGGHRELVLENVALRQQLAAMKRAQKRVPLNTGDRLFGSPWRTAGATGARLWCSFNPTPSCAGIGTGCAAGGRGVRNGDLKAVHRSIRRSAISFKRWPRRIPYGERRGFMANCGPSASMSPNARFRVC